jgi:hypothetical protein
MGAVHHPQADAIERAFDKMASSQTGVTDGGHQENKKLKGISRKSVSVVKTMSFPTDRLQNIPET